MRLLLNKEYNKFLYLVCKNINILLNVIGIKCRYDTIWIIVNDDICNINEGVSFISIITSNVISNSYLEIIGYYSKSFSLSK